MSSIQLSRATLDLDLVLTIACLAACQCRGWPVMMTPRIRHVHVARAPVPPQRSWPNILASPDDTCCESARSWTKERETDAARREGMSSSRAGGACKCAHNQLQNSRVLHHLGDRLLRKFLLLVHEIEELKKKIHQNLDRQRLLSLAPIQLAHSGAPACIAHRSLLPE